MVPPHVSCGPLGDGYCSLFPNSGLSCVLLSVASFSIPASEVAFAYATIELNCISILNEVYKLYDQSLQILLWPSFLVISLYLYSYVTLKYRYK